VTIVIARTGKGDLEEDEQIDEIDLLEYRKLEKKIGLVEQHRFSLNSLNQMYIYISNIHFK
jgi:hypothetical protein